MVVILILDLNKGVGGQKEYFSPFVYLAFGGDFLIIKTNDDFSIKIFSCLLFLISGSFSIIPINILLFDFGGTFLLSWWQLLDWFTFFSITFTFQYIC